MTTRTAALVAATMVTLTGCSGSAFTTDAAVDPESYYRDYEQGGRETAVGAQSGSAALAGAPDEVSPAWPGVTDLNTFVDVGESGFVDAAVDSRSTFALDVDTGSFDVAQEMLSHGVRPDPASVRIEEWVNSFDYSDPAPRDGDFAVTVESGTPVAPTGARLVRIGITAREIADADRPPAAITFVVDTSGSMDIRSRLGLVKSSLALLTNSLDEDDTIAIVTYGDDASALLPPTPVRESGVILDAIDALRPQGSTNMEAGLRLGYDLARESFRPEAVNTVVLASDGVANVGLTDPTALSGMLREGGERGIHLVTVGFGMGNYNDFLMEQLADTGDGFYAYVDDYTEAERLFLEQLTRTLTVVAEEARTQVRFDPALVAEYRLLGYENRAMADEDFTDVTADAGEVGSGHAVTALYAVRLREPVAGTVGEVSLRWRSTLTGGVRQLTRPVTVTPAAEGSAALRLAATVAAFADLLHDTTPEYDVQGAWVAVQTAADELAAEGRAGAAELAQMIRTARGLVLEGR